MIVAVCNFDNIYHESFNIGVPKGNYVELINSDDLQYGGWGCSNPGTISSNEAWADGRPDSITVRLAPMSVAIFKYTGM